MRHGREAILIVGAGHVGLYTALRLSKKLSLREAEVTVVDPQPHMTYQPFLPESAAGNISPRHAVVPLRHELKRCHVLAGTVTRIEHARAARSRARPPSRWSTRPARCSRAPGARATAPRSRT